MKYRVFFKRMIIPGLVTAGYVLCELGLCWSRSYAQARQKTSVEYNIIDQRNLFKSWQKPEHPKPPETETKTQPIPEVRQMKEIEGLVVTGIMFDGQRWRVIFEDRKTGEGLLLSKGDSIKGMAILEVAEDKVVLDNQGARIELLMERSSSPAEGYPPAPGVSPYPRPSVRERRGGSSRYPVRGESRERGSIPPVPPGTEPYVGETEFYPPPEIPERVKP